MHRSTRSAHATKTDKSAVDKKLRMLILDKVSSWMLTMHMARKSRLQWPVLQVKYYLRTCLRLKLLKNLLITLARYRCVRLAPGQRGSRTGRWTLTSPERSQTLNERFPNSFISFSRTPSNTIQGKSQSSDKEHSHGRISSKRRPCSRSS